MIEVEGRLYAIKFFASSAHVKRQRWKWSRGQAASYCNGSPEAGLIGLKDPKLSAKYRNSQD